MSVMLPTHGACRAYLEQFGMTLRLLGRLPEEGLSPEATDVLVAAFRGWAGRRATVTFSRVATLILDHPWSAVESFTDFFVSRYGPFVTARAMMGDRFGGARGLDIWRRANEATDGRLRLPQEHLVSVIHA